MKFSWGKTLTELGWQYGMTIGFGEQAVGMCMILTEEELKYGDGAWRLRNAHRDLWEYAKEVLA